MSPSSPPRRNTYHIKQRGCSSVVERNLAKVDVVGSNPIIRSHRKTRGCSSVVERNLAKVDVVGSNPIIRSQNKNGASSDVPFLFCLLVYKGFEPTTNGQTASKRAVWPRADRTPPVGHPCQQQGRGARVESHHPLSKQKRCIVRCTVFVLHAYVQGIRTHDEWANCYTPHTL